MKPTLRLLGGLLIVVGLLTAFFGLAFVSFGQADLTFPAVWFGVVLGSVGAVPFVPAFHQRRWGVLAVLSLAYVAVITAVLGVGVGQALQGDLEPWGLLVLIALAAPGVWGIRRGVGPRQIPEAIAPETEDRGAVLESAADLALGASLTEAHVPTRHVKVAAGLLAWSGVLAGFTGLQLVGVGFVVSWMRYVPYGMFLACVVSCGLALGVYKLRYTQGQLAVLVALVDTLTSGYWLFISVRGGIVSMFAMLLPFASLAAAVLVAKELQTLAAASKAREVLLDQGIDLGL